MAANVRRNVVLSQFILDKLGGGKDRTFRTTGAEPWRSARHCRSQITRNVRMGQIGGPILIGQQTAIIVADKTAHRHPA